MLLKDESLPKIRVNILPVAGEDALDAPLVPAQGVGAGRIPSPPTFFVL